MSEKVRKDLQKALQDGLSIISRIWPGDTKDWVISVYAADINGDGEAEVVVCSRDGRVYLYSQNGKLLWKRVVGVKKAEVRATAISNSMFKGKTAMRIVVGRQDGKIYMLDKDGRTISRDERLFSFDENGWSLEPEEEEKACWYDTKSVIRQIHVDPHPLGLQASEEFVKIIIGSEDRCAYGLDSRFTDPAWQFRTGDWVRSVALFDVNKDGQTEVLLGSDDGHVYLLRPDGQLMSQYRVGCYIHTINVADLDNDGQYEILISTDDKDLVALNFLEEQENAPSAFVKKWERHFSGRLRSLCITDIDNDGQSEIVAGSEDKHIYILDNEGELIWQHNHKHSIYSIYSYDLDNDHLPELLVGSQQNCVRAMHVRLRRGVRNDIEKYYKRLKSPDPEELLDLTFDERALLIDILQQDRPAMVTLRKAQQQVNKAHYEQALVTLLKLEQQKVESLWHKGSLRHIRALHLRNASRGTHQEIVLVMSKGEVAVFSAGGRAISTADLDDHIIDVQAGYLDSGKQENVFCLSHGCIYILGEQQRVIRRDTVMSSICILSPGMRHNQPEIIIGSEEPILSLYQGDLQGLPQLVIPTGEGVRLVRSVSTARDGMPAIVAASQGNKVLAYTRNGTCLWSSPYETKQRVRALKVIDMNNDGKVEILIGSEDRNIHVIDSSGCLIWRYYLPHTILSIEVLESRQDSQIEIFVGCADGYLYVFNKDGDLQWRYQARDRIRAISIGDIDDDGETEIILGSEDELEVLRMVNQQQVSMLLEQCWTKWCQQYPGNPIEDLLKRSEVDPLLQAFALSKLVDRDGSVPDTIEIFEEKLTPDNPAALRKASLQAVMALYMSDPSRGAGLLRRLFADKDRDVRNAVIEHLPVLMNHDWVLGYGPLENASKSPDRLSRRLVVRKLYQLIDSFAERQIGRRREIFALLLSAARYKDSEWVRQEAARTLAHFLDQYYGSLIIYTHLLIVKGIEPSVMKQISSAASNITVKRYIAITAQLLADLREETLYEQLQQMIQLLEQATDLIYGKDLIRIYGELARLFTFTNIEEIASYECLLKQNTFDPQNQYAVVILEVFEQLSLMIGRPLKSALRRENSYDRLAQLQESLKAIDQVCRFLEWHYAQKLLDEPLTALPDYQIFLLILARWQKLIQRQLDELWENTEIKVELQTKDVVREEQVSIWLKVKNIGRSSATGVNVELFYSDSFEIVGDRIFKTDTLPPGEETIAEFTLRPCMPEIALKFEVTYFNVNRSIKVEAYEDRLTQREQSWTFRTIPNPYSTGVPMHDQNMFYGREEDMAILEDNLTRNAESVIVLYGQRRSGKTTLLVQLAHSSALAHHIPVIIDMQRISYQITIESFLHRLASSIVKSMKHKQLLLAAPENEDFKDDPTAIFDDFLDRVEEQLGDRKLILLVDEFEVLEDQVNRGKLQREIFAYLRNMAQYRRFIRFLFAGTHEITEHTKQYSSVFFNIAFHHRLSRLSVTGAEDLIQKPVEGFLKYESVAVSKIRQLTADQPYLIHLMCRTIIDYCNRRGKSYVTLNDVNIVLDKVMQTGEFHLDWLWDQVKPEEHVALASLAEGGREEGRWLAFSELEEIYRRSRIRCKPEYLMGALKTLIDVDIVESEPNHTRKNTLDTHRFKIPVGLTRRWLLREHPLEIVRNEMEPDSVNGS